MKKFPLVFALAGAVLLNAAPSRSADEKSSGSFFHGSRKAQKIPKLPSPGPVEETPAAREIPFSELEEEGLVLPPKAPETPPQPAGFNRGYIFGGVPPGSVIPAPPAVPRVPKAPAIPQAPPPVGKKQP